MTLKEFLQENEFSIFEIDSTTGYDSDNATKETLTGRELMITYIENTCYKCVPLSEDKLHGFGERDIAIDANRDLFSFEIIDGLHTIGLKLYVRLIRQFKMSQIGNP